MTRIIRFRGREWVFVIFILVVAIACIRLGIWQLDRLGERNTRNTQILQQQSLPELDASRVTPYADAMVFRKATLSGMLYVDQAVRLKNRTFDGQPGEHLIAPLEFSKYMPWVLVDLGWIPVVYPSSGAVSRDLEPIEVTVSGVFLPSQPEPSWSLLADPTRGPDDPPLTAWRVLNIERIDQQLGGALLPFYLGAETSIELGDRSPIPDTIIDLSAGPHLGYAIQWFSFALIAVIGGTSWIQHQRKNKGG